LNIHAVNRGFDFTLAKILSALQWLSLDDQTKTIFFRVESFSLLYQAMDAPAHKKYKTLVFYCGGLFIIYPDIFLPSFTF